MVNSNPETVSTDFDTSDRLYFEPLDDESVRDIIENESGMGSGQEDGSANGDGPVSTIVQFGGQTAINLSQGLDVAGMPILGSSASAIDAASDRGRFEDLAAEVGIPLPPAGTAITAEDALQIADNIGYPVLVRPSYVLGGRAMEIIQNASELVRYFSNLLAIGATPGQAILVDRYLEGIEVEVDAVCDGENVLIPGIMQHIERAGVHSGDSMAVYPALSLTEAEVDTIVDYTRRIGVALGMRGLMNIQFVITGRGAYRSLSDKGSTDAESEVYIIEVNPRSSRTIPFISKVTRVPMIEIGVNVMRGKSIVEQGYEPGLAPRRDLVAVLHVQAGGRGYVPGTGDEVHRRSDGDRYRVPGCGREGAYRRGAGYSAGDQRLIEYFRRRQGHSAAVCAFTCRERAPALRDCGNCGADQVCGVACRGDREAFI